MNSLPRLAAPLLFLLSIHIASAQDVFVTAPQALPPGDAPDVMPAPKSKLDVEYPPEMRKASEIGYVILIRGLDVKAEVRTSQRLGTHIVFQRAVEGALKEGWTFAPARRDGKAADCMFWVAVIFNPAGSGRKLADAGPRLAAVAPVFATLRRQAATGTPTALVRFELDASGAITHVAPQEPLNPTQRAALDLSLSSWKFEPARKAGAAIASEVTLPVLFVGKPSDPKEVATRAKPVHQVPPTYPPAMRRFGLGAEVTVDFIVDTDGSVKNAYVAQSNNPRFDDAAVEAVRQWKFEPGTKGGRPVASHQQIPIVFTLNGGGDEAFQIFERGSQSKLPPELRFDTPPKFRNVQLPIYPYALWKDGVTGKARVGIVIGRNGRVEQVKVLQADRPEFGLALAAAAERFVFEPALKDGNPVPHLLNFEQEFSWRELPDEAAENLLSLERKHPEKIVGGAKLDTPLTPLARRPPQFPLGVSPDVTDGQAVIEFLVDEDGRVRLPRTVSATLPEFGYAATLAVAGWWFEPPKSGGKSVVVRAQVPFNFKLPTAPKR